MPEEVALATKPRLAHRMLKRAHAAGVRAAWVVADCAYGDARYLGVWLEEKEQPYVLGVSGKAHAWAGLHQPTRWGARSSIRFAGGRAAALRRRGGF